ncbi:MAG: hypothetical protein UR26_C0001G0060 [candidate division TM6 bacterium GW2011_GWF2_32_72]|nr:MAG: hypothetical protein UR26_C0001G0060 [candidate division TM6 bacterium GW2011_GWF2_32_72]
MRAPIWILNILFLITFILVVLATLFFESPIPKRVRIESSQPEAIITSTEEPDIKKIYELDLFGTYQPGIEQPLEEPKLEIQIPPAPEPKKPETPKIPEVKFLNPLDITLKGVIAVSDDTKNIAIIADNKSKVEKNYKVNDKIEDSQIIKIFKNKVLFIRSNGQLETTYLTHRDVSLDHLITSTDGWNKVVYRIEENKYYLDPVEFKAKVNNLAQFIEMLDLSTVTQKAQNIGSRIGKMSDKSFGKTIGLETGDIIISINDIPANNTNNRFEIYKLITSLNTNDEIKIKAQRKQIPFDLSITLKQAKEIPTKKEDSISLQTSVQEGKPMDLAETIREEKLKILKSKYDLAPTLRDMRIQEKRNMFDKGKRELFEKLKR